MPITSRAQVVLMTAAVLVVAAGCSAATMTHPAKHDWVQLQSTTDGSRSWRFLAREQGSQLCLQLEPVTQTAGTADGAGGCGFDDRRPGSGFFASGPGPAGSVSSFGPLPASATQIRIARNQVIPSYPLPSGHGLPAGRFWIFIPPKGWPDATSGPAVDPQPLDEHGNPVPFTDF